MRALTQGIIWCKDLLLPIEKFQWLDGMFICECCCIVFMNLVDLCIIIERSACSSTNLLYSTQL
jgi:hypothetical protein